MATIKKNAAAGAKAEEKKPAAATKPAAKPAAAKAAPTKAATPAKTAPVKKEAEAEVAAAANVGRKEIAARIRDKVAATGAAISPKVAEIAAVAYEEVVSELLAEGNKVSLPGFGVFSVGHREAREAINPQDPKGAKIQLAACNVPKFKPGKKLKAAVNGGAEVAEEGEGE